MLDESTIAKIKNIMFQFLDPKKDKVFIFGSRATGKGRKFSDIDIGIECHDKISEKLVGDIKEKFEESDLPYMIDVVNFSHVSDTFKKVSMQKIIYLN